MRIAMAQDTMVVVVGLSSTAKHIRSPVCSGSPRGPLEACLPFTMCTAMAVRGGRIASASALLAWSSSASGMTSAGTLSSRSRPHRR